MTVEQSPKKEIWERLERGRQLKASQGGYVGYGSPPFGLIPIQKMFATDRAFKMKS